MKLKIDNWCTLPTPMGKFRMYDSSDENYSVICMGDISAQGEWPLFRVHSSCRASEVFGALDCDCADQLTETMKNIASEGRGIVVYQLQEGRGHGLSVKINAVRTMEDKQVDTAEAFELLGIEQDVRSYAEAVSVLKQLDIEKVRLVSNNPRKHQFLNDHGIQTSVVHTNPNIRPENKEYLHTKNDKLGHNLPLESESNNDKPVHFYHSDQPWGELSNFSRHSVFIDSIIWPTTEHYYQAQKFESHQLKEQIRCAASPMLAKSIAHQHLEKYGRTDWINVRERFMLRALRAKFTQHPDLAAKLQDTGHRLLIELTDNDEYWGDPGDGSGQNRLGQLLMQVRAELKNESAVPTALAEVK
ncbi:GTP cyclohydrolase II RibA [Alteromonas sp. C1M14]|uniref:GTP cyclohydrolase II RibA n=1 Tax=Alteromonas sp. C1M14 TaxID=2841567 RepID=UPI001C08335D|nr:GTP cyclohydrolase II RibA [Alteromonas sp. C1M14]